MATSKRNEGTSVTRTEVPFDYIKSQHFRVLHVDGAIGGLTPTGNIHVALYSERPALPQRLVFKVTPEGTLGDVDESATISRNSIVREVEVDAIMSLDVATALHQWLGERLAEAAATATDRQSDGTSH